jgi:hypothetical protein
MARCQQWLADPPLGRDGASITEDGACSGGGGIMSTQRGVPKPKAGNAMANPHAKHSAATAGTGRS